MAEGLRVQAASLEVKRLESLSRPPCYDEVVSSLGRSAFLLSMSRIDAIDIGARETSQERTFRQRFNAPVYEYTP